MEPAWVGAQGESERHLWSTVVQKAAVELTERAREISDAVTVYQTEWLPDLLDNSEALEGIRASTEASIRDFAEVLRSGADPVKAVKLGSATVDYALDGAQHGVPLTTLMRSYRLGHAATSRHLRAILAKHAADADELTSATDLCSAWLFAYVDTALCLVEDVYVTERERWLRSAAASQAEAISTILSGQPIDIDVAGRRLRHDLRRVHVAAIAWLDTHEEGRNTLALLEAAIRDIAAAIGNQRPLIQPLGTLSIAAWISTSSRGALQGPRRAAVPERDGTGCPRRDRRTRARHRGVSRQPCRGARSAADRAAGGPPRGQHHPLPRHRPARAGHREHRPGPRTSWNASWVALASRDDTTRRLAATVRTYLDENGSRGRTAKRLSIHENTVAYRLRQAEELLGRSVDKRTLELRVALALADLVDEAPAHA